MSQTRSHRGRPKGTGLDDHARLLAVAQLMAQDPDLKTTTAIKSTGVTDPSTIRRLRDKFHAIKDELCGEITSGAAVATPRVAALNSAQSKKKAPISAQATPTPVHKSSDPAQPQPGSATAAAATSRSAPGAEAWFSLWYGLGMQSVSSAIGLQISFLEKVLRMPQVATALRGQMALNEMAVAWCPKTTSKDKTLH